jgi:hypothetical protein
LVLAYEVAVDFVQDPVIQSHVQEWITSGQYAALGGYALIHKHGPEISLVESEPHQGKDTRSQEAQQDSEEDHVGGMTIQAVFELRDLEVIVRLHWRWRTLGFPTLRTKVLLPSEPRIRRVYYYYSPEESPRIRRVQILFLVQKPELGALI